MMIRTSALTAMPQDKAIVTFMRPTVFGGAIQFGIWDGESFVGVLSANSYIQYAAKPGEHIFMARAENWSYVKANLESGKKYYVIGRVVPGAFKARVALDPIKQVELARPAEMERIAGWLRGLKPTTPKADMVESYVKPRLKQVQQGLEEFRGGKVKYAVLEAQDGK